MSLGYEGWTTGTWIVTLAQVFLIVHTICGSAVLSETPQNRKLNVIFIVSDDMRPELGSYKGKHFPSPVSPRMHTPYLDTLAKSGFVALNAHVQYGMCGPSRTSFLTSRRPDTTHVYDNRHYFRKVGGNFTTLPQYFKQNGYVSIGMGKIFHPGLEASGYDDPPSWSKPYWHPPNEDYWLLKKTKTWEAVPEGVLKSKPLPDEQTKNHALETLTKLASGGRSGEQPFFMAVGFLKPHLPFIFPDKYLDFYPEDQLHLPPNDYAPVDMPHIAWSDYYELRQYRDLDRFNLTGAINSTLPEKEILALRRAYYSALTYTDTQVGHVLDQVDKLGLRENTIISFIGDHGWQLGEHGEWCKHTNFELSTHAPLILSVPGKTEKGITSDQLIEFVDIFPTIVDLAGLPSIPRCPKPSDHVQLCSEGVSFANLLDIHQNSLKKSVGNYDTRFNLSRKRIFLGDAIQEPTLKNKAFSQFIRSSGGKPVMGYSLRNSAFRYTEWVGFHGRPEYQPIWEHNYGVELYDHDQDPEENNNVVHYKAYEQIREQLSLELHKGWWNQTRET